MKNQSCSIGKDGVITARDIPELMHNNNRDNRILLDGISQSGYFMVNKVLIRRLGANCALQLSLYIDCARNFGNEFHFTHEQFSESLGFDPATRNKHDKKLQELGLISKKMRGAPPKMKYSLNATEILDFISEFQGMRNTNLNLGKIKEVNLGKIKEVHNKEELSKKELIKKTSTKESSSNLVEKEPEEVYLVGEYKNIRLTMNQYKKLESFYGTKIHLIQVIDKLCAKLEENPKAYKNHYLTLRNWKAYPWARDYFPPEDTHQHAWRVSLPGCPPYMPRGRD